MDNPQDIILDRCRCSCFIFFIQELRTWSKTQPNAAPMDRFRIGVRGGVEQVTSGIEGAWTSNPDKWNYEYLDLHYCPEH